MYSYVCGHIYVYAYVYMYVYLCAYMFACRYKIKLSRGEKAHALDGLTNKHWTF